MSSPIRFEDVREGDPLPVLELWPEITQVVKWSGATWTFVPIFYDLVEAKRLGLEDTLVPGPMKLALFCTLLQRWAGDEVLIRSLRVAYRRPDTPRRLLRLLGAVTGTAEVAGVGAVEVELWSENDRGERTVSGAATIHLPLRPS